MEHDLGHTQNGEVVMDSKKKCNNGREPTDEGNICLQQFLNVSAFSYVSFVCVLVFIICLFLVKFSL